jgi:hypothetical protein
LATTVYTVEEVELQDGRIALLRPLVVKRLRRFMKMMAEMGTTDDEEVIEDIMLNCAAFCISKEHPQYWDVNKHNGSYPDPDYVKVGAENEDIPKIDRMKGGYTEEFEEAADMPTVTKIIEVCGGINFSDPNLLRAAQEAAAQVGTTD